MKEGKPEIRLLRNLDSSQTVYTRTAGGSSRSRGISTFPTSAPGDD